MLANQVVKQRTNDLFANQLIKPSFFSLNIKDLSLISWSKMSTTPYLLMSLLLFTFLLLIEGGTLLNYRKIPKISPSMCKPLQI